MTELDRICKENNCEYFLNKNGNVKESTDVKEEKKQHVLDIAAVIAMVAIIVSCIVSDLIVFASNMPTKDALIVMATITLFGIGCAGAMWERRFK